MADDKFASITPELRENYAAIVAERGITYDHLAVNADAIGDGVLAAYLRSQATGGDTTAPPQERQAPPAETAAAAAAAPKAAPTEPPAAS